MAVGRQRLGPHRRVRHLRQHGDARRRPLGPAPRRVARGGDEGLAAVAEKAARVGDQGWRDVRDRRRGLPQQEVSAGRSRAGPRDAHLEPARDRRVRGRRAHSRRRRQPSRGGPERRARRVRRGHALARSDGRAPAPQRYARDGAAGEHRGCRQETREDEKRRGVRRAVRGDARHALRRRRRDGDSRGLGAGGAPRRRGRRRGEYLRGRPRVRAPGGVARDVGAAPAGGRAGHRPDGAPGGRPARVPVPGARRRRGCRARGEDPFGAGPGRGGLGARSRPRREARRVQDRNRGCRRARWREGRGPGDVRGGSGRSDGRLPARRKEGRPPARREEG